MGNAWKRFVSASRSFVPRPTRSSWWKTRTPGGTCEVLTAARQPHWEIQRNEKNHGIDRLVHTLRRGYEQVLSRTTCQLVLKLDLDALIIKPGLIAEALEYMRANPEVGMFGVHEVDYNRPRNYDVHTRLMEEELAWRRRLAGSDHHGLVTSGGPNATGIVVATTSLEGRTFSRGHVWRLLAESAR